MATRGQICADLDAIRHDLVRAAAQAGLAMHGDMFAADAVDHRAHGDQALRQVGDLGLARGILQHGGAVGQRCGHQQVLGGTDTNLREADHRALQALLRLGLDIAVLDIDLGAHRLETP
jgi:hypothetical protein